VIESVPQKLTQILERPNFDNFTKAEESQNRKVELNRQLQEYQHERNREDNQHRHLAAIERDVIDTVEQGPIINLSKEWRDNFERVFKQLQQKEAKEQAEKFAKDKLIEQTNDVDREHYLVAVLEDAFFEPRLEVIVRESVDGERECLDFILERINTTHTEERISMTEFFSYFCRRGRLRDNETAVW